MANWKLLNFKHFYIVPGEPNHTNPWLLFSRSSLLFCNIRETSLSEVDLINYYCLLYIFLSYFCHLSASQSGWYTCVSPSPFDLHHTLWGLRDFDKPQVTLVSSWLSGDWNLGVPMLSSLALKPRRHTDSYESQSRFLILQLSWELALPFISFSINASPASSLITHVHLESNVLQFLLNEVYNAEFG